MSPVYVVVGLYNARLRSAVPHSRWVRLSDRYWAVGSQTQPDCPSSFGTPLDFSWHLRSSCPLPDVPSCWSIKRHLSISSAQSRTPGSLDYWQSFSSRSSLSVSHNNLPPFISRTFITFRSNKSEPWERLQALEQSSLCSPLGIYPYPLGC